MKKFSNITILVLSLGLVSAPIHARQAIDDYVGYDARYADNPAERNDHGTKALTRLERVGDGAAKLARNSQNIDDREARRVGKLLWNQNTNTDDREARRVGKLLWSLDIDDHEARRIGKMLWDLDIDTDDHEARRIGKLLWISSYVKGAKDSTKY